MNQRLGICRHCNRCGRLNAKEVCSECTYKSNHGGKSRQQVQWERHCSKPIKGRKITGEYDLFVEIWNERPHVCENCKDKIEFGSRREFVRKFSHIKSKGAYPELRLVKDNIEINCDICHNIWEFGDRENFYKRKDLYA